jgi:hypothetical protein
MDEEAPVIGGRDDFDKIINEADEHAAIIAVALKEVHMFIAKKKRLLYGGMAIDLALHAKGARLYGPDVLPDYDFMTPVFHADAYDLGVILHKKELPNVECINAMHPSTMKVRTNFIGVADISYVPAAVYEQIPYITYNGLRVVHPHFQMIDQHLALCMPYRGAPWEVIKHRWKKDMVRYDLLHKHYPIEVDQKLPTSEYRTPMSKLEGQCVGGFVGLQLLINMAVKQGFAPSIAWSAEITEGDIKGTMPVDSHGITIHSDDLWAFDKSMPKKAARRWYNSFLEKIPRKVVVGEYEVIDNYGSRISAHYDEESGLWLANPQVLCLYFLANYMIFKMKEAARGQSFLVGYKACQDLVKWAATKYESDPSVAKYLPSPFTFGSHNISELYSHTVKKIAMHLKLVPREEVQPKTVYFRDLPAGVIPPERYDFKPEDIKGLQFDGAPTHPFSSAHV